MNEVRRERADAGHRGARAVGTIGLVAVVAGALFNVAHTIGRQPVPPLVASASPPDAVMAMERRLARLRFELERRGLRGPIGYVGDLPGARVLDDPQTVADFFQSQFVLVPAVLDLSVERREWAVANLRAPEPRGRLPAGFVVVEDFGAGVYLLRKAAP
jgi:hypothetical protein